MVLSCKKSAEYIASHSTHVNIKRRGIEKLGDIIVQEIKSGTFSSSNFSQADVHPSPGDHFALDWILVVDTLNFCFWNFKEEDGWRVEGHSGYFALCAALNRAVKNEPEFLNPEYYSNITENQLAKLLKGDNDVKIPLLAERVQCLNEVGTVLLKKFDGSFDKLVKEADGSAERLLNLIVTNFQCFRDEAEFKGERVALYKRAQILVGDIWACFKNEGVGHFTDIEQITMFADYRVPQTLVYFNAIEYSEELLKKLDANTILENGSIEEVEIRGNSIQTVELLQDYISTKLADRQVNCIMIDHFLWDFRRKHAEEIEQLKIPFHKTFSIYY